LPVDASVEFGEQLTRHVLPNLIMAHENDVIINATITENGKLTPRFSYLEDFVA
jgi:hypothetical protein